MFDGWRELHTHMENLTPMLSPLALHALKPKDKRDEVTDKNGLVIRISPNGRMTWRINKSVNGKRITRQLGDYPAISLAAARMHLISLLIYQKPLLMIHSREFMLIGLT